MKLTIKTLSQNTFKVDIEAEKTVKELKDIIEKDHGKDYPSGYQKLIYSGKILADDKKIAEYEIDEKKFVVLMITRPPAVQKAPVAEKVASSTTAATKKDESETSKSSATASSDNKSSSSSSSNPASSTVNATTNLSSASSSSTTTTTAPTTTTTSSESATPSRARTNEPTTVRPSTEATRASSAIGAGGLLSGEPQMASRLANLMSQPQFRQIQDLIQQSPHLLSSTIDALASSDPEMYSFISENPDVFVSALNHPPLASGRNQSGGGGGGGGHQQPSSRSGGTASQQAAQNPHGRQQPVVDQVLVDVSEHDKEAIERLKELGFSEYLAVQAYMACDKDEQLAANLLFQMDQ